jgi:hypothetical protein
MSVRLAANFDNLGVRKARAAPVANLVSGGTTSR